MEGPEGITKLLRAVRDGDLTARSRVVELLYDPLKAIARRRLARPLPGGTFSPTVLVHEAYLKLAQQDGADWRDREHFLAVAATAMRHIVVDYARRKRSAKRGAGAHHTLVDGSRLGVDSGAVDMIALDQALDRLSRLDERLTRTVELRYFAGLTVEETARVLEVSPRTVKSDWQKARILLHRFLQPDPE